MNDPGYEISENMRDKVTTLLGRHYIRHVEFAINDAIIQKTMMVDRPSRSDIRKEVETIRSLVINLKNCLDTISRDSYIRILPRLPCGYKYKHKSQLPSLLDDSGNKYLDPFAFMERVKADLDLLVHSISVISSRGRLGKYHISYLIYELACIWRDHYGCLPKRSYNSYSGKESGKFRELVLLAVQEVDPDEKQLDGVLRNTLESLRKKDMEDERRLKATRLITKTP